MKTLNLALQGGGSHGAFTWGVLDALLADPRIALEGLSGTSAGAVNAVALASGYAKALAAGSDPRRGARDSLARIWDQIAAWGTVGSLQKRFGSMLWGGVPPELAPTIWTVRRSGLHWHCPSQGVCATPSTVAGAGVRAPSAVGGRQRG